MSTPLPSGLNAGSALASGARAGSRGSGVAGGGGGGVGALQNVVNHWDYSSGSLADLVGSTDVTNVGLTHNTTDIGSNGLASLRGAGGSSCIQRVSTTGDTPITNLNPSTDPFGFTIVMRCSGSGNCVFFDTKAITGARPHAIQTVTPLHYMTADASISLQTSPLTNASHVLYYEFAGANSKIYIDGALVASGNAGVALPGQGYTFWNTALRNISNYSQFSFGEAKVSLGVQTPGDIEGEYTTLAAKWGF